MQDGRDLLQTYSKPLEAGQANTMFIVLEGFMDAGKAAAGAAETLKECLTHRDVAAFDVDQLVDFRSRRPPMHFTGRRFGAVTWPELRLELLFDEQEQPFYLLSGPEPDYRWRQFSSAVGQLVDELGITRVLTGHGVPWAAPHTRPLRRLTHASSDALIGDRPGWSQSVKVPGYLAALLEMDLAAAGHDVVGLSVQVPHYLTDLVFPPASLSLLDGWSEVAGLRLPHGNLAELGQGVLAEVDQQTRSSQELGLAVSHLEHTYDEELTQDDAPWTEGDIADQVERFLRDLGDDNPS